MVHPRSRRARCSAGLLLLATALAACSPGGEPAPPGAPAIARVSRPKALFLVLSSADPSWRLHQLDEAGIIRRVEFSDDRGAPVDLEIGILEVLSRGWVRLAVMPPGARDEELLNASGLLLRIADGRLFDRSDLDWSTAPQLKGTDRLYAVARRALRRIDLTTMDMHVLSDPAVDPVAGPELLVDHDGNVRVPAHTGARVGFHWTIFFADGGAPVEDPSSPAWPEPDFCNTPHAGNALATMYGEDDHLYTLCASLVPDPYGSTPVARREYFVRQVSFTRVGSRFLDLPPIRTVACTAADQWNITCPESHLPERLPIDRRPRLQHRFLTSGFFTMRPVPAGGFSVSWADLVPPRDAVHSGGFAWWRTGDDLVRVRLEAGATPETVATVPGLVRWTAVGGVLVYTRSVAGGGLGTYQVSGPGASPRLVSSSDMRISQIVEL